MRRRSPPSELGPPAVGQPEPTQHNEVGPLRRFRRLPFTRRATFHQLSFLYTFQGTKKERKKLLVLTLSIVLRFTLSSVVVYNKDATTLPSAQNSFQRKGESCCVCQR